MYFYQYHHTVIELKPNESRLFRLPPMSNSDGRSVIIEISQHTVDDDLPEETEPGVPHIDWYAVRTLYITLMHGNTVVKTSNKEVKDPNTEADSSLHLSANSLWHDDLWRLRVQRGSRPSLKESRKYRIGVRYPSQMPVVERRIPLKFFQKAFEEIWNKQQYVKASFDGSKFKIEFRDDLAGLYNIPKIEKKLPNWLEIQGFETKAILGIGAGPRPNGPQGTGNSVFVSVRLRIMKGQVRVVILDEITTPAITALENYINIRFYLHQGDVNMSSLRFEASVDTHSGIFNSLRHVIPSSLEDNLESYVEDLNKFITSFNGSAHFGVLDKYVKPWFVGGLAEPGNMPFELQRIHYEGGSEDRPDPRGIIEPATGNLVVSFIGRRDNPGDIHDTQVIDESSVRRWLMLNGFDASQGMRSIMSTLSVSSINRQLIKISLIPLFDNIGLEEQIHVLPVEGLPLPTNPSFQRLFKIDHIVVLMQENRSFDQVLGYLRRNKINNEVNGLLPEDDPGSLQQMNKFLNQEFRPRKAAVYGQNPGPNFTWTSPTAWPRLDLHNPHHSADAVADQINGGEDGSPGGMKGFVSNFAKRIGNPYHFYLRQVMDYFDATDLPVYDEIARQFGICDNWFCSFAGGTLPNRFVSLSGKLNRDRFGNIEEDNPNIEGGEAAPITTPTLFDYLALHEKTWRVYEHGYGTMRLFAKYTFDITNVLQFNDPIQGFEAAASAGTLPNVTWIEPDYIELPPGNDDHAPADMKDGQLLVERIVKALVKSPKWNKTLLIITYDEHGGFYDHVTPPINDPPLGDSRRTMGPRVPTFIISPLIKPGSVFHQRFDHTSIGATILRRFCKQQPKISERLDKAPDMSEVLELADAPLPRTDFGKFGSTRPKPTLNTTDLNFNIPGSNPSETPSELFSLKTDSKKEDFHWYLMMTSLFTGRSGNPSSFNPNSVRRWLMLNGFDASQGMRSIMSTLSVSSIKQLLQIHT